MLGLYRHHFRYLNLNRIFKLIAMKNNMGTIDRIVRIVVVVGLVALYFTDTVTGLWGTVALVAAGIFTLTSLVGFCPIYAVFGVKTCKVQ